MYYSTHRTVRVVITRYHSSVIIQKLAFLLSSLQNLHTLQVFHAHTQLTTSIENGLQGVVLPGIRTLIIPEHCHAILKCCPQVTKVWCNHGDGSELVEVIAKYCKEVQEIRGFSPDVEEVVTGIIEAVPNLRVLEIDGGNYDPMVDAISSFKDINTIIIKPCELGLELDQCIETFKQVLNDLAPSKERRHIRIWHRGFDEGFHYGYHRSVRGINTYVRGYYTEVPI